MRVPVGVSVDVAVNVAVSVAVAVGVAVSVGVKVIVPAIELMIKSCGPVGSETAFEGSTGRISPGGIARMGSESGSKGGVTWAAR